MKSRYEKMRLWYSLLVAVGLVLILFSGTFARNYYLFTAGRTPADEMDQHCADFRMLGAVVSLISGYGLVRTLERGDKDDSTGS